MDEYRMTKLRGETWEEWCIRVGHKLERTQSIDGSKYAVGSDGRVQRLGAPEGRTGAVGGTYYPIPGPGGFVTNSEYHTETSEERIRRAFEYREIRFWVEYLELKIQLMKSTGGTRQDIELKFKQELKEWGDALPLWEGQGKQRVICIYKAYEEVLRKGIL